MNKIWSARWITDREFSLLSPIDLYRKELDRSHRTNHRADLRNRHMLTRKEFALGAIASEVYLDITGDDYYKVFINGFYVGQGPAQSVHFHYYYNRFEISSLLRRGVNTIAVHVYYQGLISHAYNSGDYRQGLIAEVMADGRVVVETDHSWKYIVTKEFGNGAVIAYDTQYAEHIDSRMKAMGWKENDFDDTLWKNAVESRDDDHRLSLQPTPPLAVYERAPAAVSSVGENGYLIDFGSELTGLFRLRASGEAGRIVEIRCGEELNEEGRVRYDMRCNCLYQEYWTLSGRDDDEPEWFDYKAFRYAEALAEPGVRLNPESFTAVVRHYPLDDEACVFDSSDTRLNAIWEICRNGVKFGSQETYVDCPSREKGQYLGDNTIITHAHAYLAGGDLRLFRKSLHDFALFSQKVCPGLMAVSSGSYMQEIADFSLQWPLQLLQYYKQSGDLDFLAEMYPVAERLLRHFRQFRREDGLLAAVADKWNLVDWPENMRDGYDFELSYPIGAGSHNVLNAFYYGALKTTAEIREIVFGSASASQLEELDRTKTGFQRAFFRKEIGLFADAENSGHNSLHANALPLLFGLVPKQAEQSVVAFMRAKRLSCGVYMAYFVLQALAAAGEYELVYDLITSDDLHSWNTMLREGATTCFETWSKDLKPNASLCHAWASAPIPVMIEHIIGIQPASPGWNQVRFAPHLPEALHEVSLKFRTPAGMIAFAYSDGHMQLAVPDGVSVIVPNEQTRNGLNIT